MRHHSARRERVPASQRHREDDAINATHGHGSIKQVRAPWPRSHRAATLLGVAAGLVIGTAPASAAPGPATYYVAPTGNDRAAGTSPARPWRTLARVEAASLRAGARVLLRRGGTWRGRLRIAPSGAPGRPITVGAYGSGPGPRIAGGRCVVVDGSYVTVSGLALSGCDRAGVTVNGDFARIAGNVITRNIAGVEVNESSSGAQIVLNRIVDNNRMVSGTSGADDDNGAFGVLLHGDGAVVARNTIIGSDASSPDYGRDGAAVEIYGARNSSIRNNTAIGNNAFTELGNPRSANNTYAGNVVRSSLAVSIFLVTRGGGSRYGPIRGTRVVNNTVRLTGASSEGFVCHDGCSGAVLFMRNNIIQAVKKVGFADGALDEDYDLFFGGIRQFRVGSHSRAADPRFVAPQAGDLRLRRGSPAIDAGVPVGLRLDVLGRGIPVDGDRDGRAEPDIGAFEVPG